MQHALGVEKLRIAFIDLIGGLAFDPGTLDHQGRDSPTLTGLVPISLLSLIFLLDNDF